MEAGIGERLETVEKNPGPRMGGRGKTAENRRARRERRYGRRRERREGRGRVGGIMGGGSVVGGGLNGVDAYDSGNVELAEGIIEGTEQG